MTIKRKQACYGGIILILFIAAYYPALQILVTKWANSEEYMHAFLIVPVIFYMIWAKRKTLCANPNDYSYLGLLLIIPSIALYYFALLTQVDTIILLSMFFTIVGTIIYLAGVTGLKEIFTPLLLLLMLIPVPEQLYTLLTFPLQLKVSEISEVVVRMFDIPILREGNVMQIPRKSFEVVEACSGLRSIISFLTLSVLIGSFGVKYFSSKLILVSVSIPLAVFVNIIRIVSMITLYHFFNLDLTEGAGHTVTGILVFLVAIVILILLQNTLELWEQKKIQSC